jgi:hypothetical protein
MAAALQQNGRLRKVRLLLMRDACARDRLGNCKGHLPTNAFLHNVLRPPTIQPCRQPTLLFGCLIGSEMP